MVANNVSICPICNGDLKQLSYIKRIVRGKGGKISWVNIRKLVCENCGKIHRELPEYLMPYKHYEVGIIHGVIDGRITTEDLDYEDYPCDTTINDWIRARKKHLL